VNFGRSTRRFFTFLFFRFFLKWRQGLVMFTDRADAGTKLAKALEFYRNRNALVLGIPRGGAETAYYVAKHLNADFSIVVSRKLPFPDNPEAGFGAITEDGSIFLIEHFRGYLPTRVVRRIIEEQKQEINRRVTAFRGSLPLPAIEGRTVIVVDDGIAMGSTMRAAVMLCRNKSAAYVVVAAPVAAPDTVDAFKKIADDVVILETPEYFQAVAQVYLNWYDLSDEEVLAIMRRREQEKQL
jgi:putative phosphoribosyl transferase